MSPRDTIAALRRGEVPDEEALRAFAAGLADGGVSDARARFVGARGTTWTSAWR